MPPLTRTEKASERPLRACASQAVKYAGEVFACRGGGLALWKASGTLAQVMHGNAECIA